MSSGMEGIIRGIPSLFRCVDCASVSRALRFLKCSEKVRRSVCLWDERCAKHNLFLAQTQSDDGSFISIQILAKRRRRTMKPLWKRGGTCCRSEQRECLRWAECLSVCRALRFLNAREKDRDSVCLWDGRCAKHYLFRVKIQSDDGGFFSIQIFRWKTPMNNFNDLGNG